MRWTRQRFARDGIAGLVERLVSDQQHADERRLLRTAKSCGPDAPTLASSSRSCVGPTGLRQNISADDGGKRARSPGRARHKLLKPLRAGMPGDPGVPVASTPVLSTLHRGLRVHRAPGIPHALKGAEDKCTARALRAARSRMRIWNWSRDEECVPRMLRSAISAFTRVFDALCLAAWCAADPGPILHSASPWVPALRCIVKNAAPRPGHEMTATTELSLAV